jgi:hypothetical protein
LIFPIHNVIYRYRLVLRADKAPSVNSIGKTKTTDFTQNFKARSKNKQIVLSFLTKGFLTADRKLFILTILIIILLFEYIPMLQSDKLYDMINCVTCHDFKKLIPK